MHKVIIFLLAIALTAASQSAPMPYWLQTAKGEVSAIIRMASNTSSPKNAAVTEAARHTPEFHAQVIERLKSNAETGQKSLIRIIESAGDKISEYKSYWISNCIYVRGDAGVIRSLATHPEVEEIIEDFPIALVEPIDSGEIATSTTAAEPGLNMVEARGVWEMGLKGAGRIVCNFDTGVNGNHVALASRWRGANGASVAASWFDPYTNTTFPMDTHGHGTHTMGTIVGMNGADTVGVAFESQWIAAAVVDRGGGFQRTIADILAAFQWAADPDGNPMTIDDVPDVINNSWGVPAGYLGGCDATFWEAIDNVEAAGAVCLFAAGNEGPYPFTIRTPADRIASPYNCLAVGALNGTTGQIANFSSRGPSGCDSLTIKPELVAPGVNIRSCDKNGGYRLMSGTSMATPHVAGAVAIMRQFNPQATVNQIKAALLSGAVDLGSPGDDNDYGHGKLNIMRSLYNMPPPAHPFVHVISCQIRDGRDDLPGVGETINLDLVFDNIGSAGSIGALLRSLSSRALVRDSSMNYGWLDRFDTLRTNGFSITISSDAQPGDTLRFAIDFQIGVSNQRYEFWIIVVDSAAPSVATIITDSLEFSFSNFGQFGLGNTSFNPQGGRGFRYPVGGIDFLKESSLLISHSGRVSDGARNNFNQPDNDFRPIPGNLPRVYYPGIYADYDGYSGYSDSAAENPIGVGVSQKCFAWNGNYKFVIAEFTITNYNQVQLTNLRAALYCDWDLPLSSGVDDVVGYVDWLSLGYIMDMSTGKCVGIRSLTSNASSYRAIANSVDFANGFSDSAKNQFMSEGFVQVSYSAPSNYAHILSVGPYDIAAGDSETVAFAFIYGGSLTELTEQAQQAFWMYPNLTGADDGSINKPTEISLGQNYPNPFNSTTIIETITDSPSQLGIFDICGRQVRMFALVGNGKQTIVWDGRDDHGQEVAAGVYFYKIGGDSCKPRKMILLK